MRLKRLMSIVLAVALVMSFAMTASAASTLYYAQDFNYANTKQMQGDANNVGSNGFFEKNNAATFSYDVPTYKANGKNMVVDHGGFFNESNTLTINGFGNTSLKAPNDKGIGFFPTNSWDANAANQTYVISLDLDTNNISTFSTNYSYATVIGNRGTAEAPVYNGARVLNMSTSGVQAPTTAQATGTNLGLAKSDTKRVALGFKYDSANSVLKRDVAVNGVSLGTGGTFELSNMTTVEGITFALKPGKTPNIGKLRMYTIDDTEGFKVTSTVDGEKRLPVDTSSVAITFTQPVSDVTADAAVFTLKKGTETVDTLSGTIVTTGTVGSSYVSTATLTLPKLEEGADYEIVVTGVTNELGAELAKSTISFSTPKPPITTAAPTITNATVGAMSEASVAVSNNTVDESKTISVIYAVYNKAGALCDVVYANDTVAADATVTISAGIKLGSDAARVKAMVWDGLSNISPFTGFVSADVAAQ